MRISCLFCKWIKGSPTRTIYAFSRRYESFSIAYDGSDKLAESHVGSLIVDYLYVVGRTIGVPITGSILKFMIVFTSIELILSLIVTL